VVGVVHTFYAEGFYCAGIDNKQRHTPESLSSFEANRSHGRLVVEFCLDRGDRPRGSHDAMKELEVSSKGCLAHKHDLHREGGKCGCLD